MLEGIMSINNMNAKSFSDLFTNTTDYYFTSDYNGGKYSTSIKAYSAPDLYVNTIRKDFPILSKRINGKPLVWMDNGATTQKPLCVIEALEHYYKEYNSNVHRGAHTLSQIATREYESARESIGKFIGATPEEVIFLRGTTEAINLAAQSFGSMCLHANDEILISNMEHHSNIVPWQKIAKQTGANLKVMPINDHGEIIMEEYEKLVTSQTKIVALTHVSNVLGTINPIKKMIEIAHKSGAYVLIDGAQAVAHMPVNVKSLDADFYAFSGHKVFGPTGIGVLYGKKELLEKMPPWQTGGGMIKNVTFSDTTYNSLPDKFEAGTGNIADAIGLKNALNYIDNIGMNSIYSYEKLMADYAMESLRTVKSISIIGTSPCKSGVLSFVIDGIDPERIALYLNNDGIAVRSGHHCAQPTLKRYGVTSCVRASLAVYNTMEEIDTLVGSLNRIKG